MKLTKIILSLLMISSIAFGEVSEVSTEETINVNFRNLNVKDFIEMVSKITKKNILIETELKGKINFISQTPIKKSGLFSLANSILGSKGLTIIDLGDFYKVVKTASAAGEGLPVTTKIEGDTMKTVIFPLHNSNAAVVRAKIKPLLHKSAQVISFKENNVLAITAYPRTLKSISQIISVVEERGEKKSVVLELKNSAVKDVFSNAQNMAKKLFPQTIESEKVDIFKDDATNSIILVGKKNNINRMIKYIKQLDLEGEDQSQKMYVLRLKNSNVEEMEKILSKLLSQMNSVATKTAKKGGKPPSKAMVVSDVERNALILLATGEQIKNIRETVKKIDIPKVQVYVKAKIVEVDTNLATKIGMKYGLETAAITSKGLYSMTGNLGTGALQMSSSLLGFLNEGSTTTQFDQNGNAYENSDPAFKFDSVDKVFALGAQLDLLETNGAARLLSEPSVLCTNNKEAEIYVGQTRSILTQGQQSTTGGSNVINNYSREDIGLTLKVKPRLSSNNQVTLEVETTIEDIDPSSEQIADRPTTTKRKVKTNAIVNNGETIILGGLMKKVGGKSSSSIPVLGELPILGDLLFSDKSDVENQQNVIIYLTPYIVRKSGDLEKLKGLLSELDAVQNRYNALVREHLEEDNHRAFSSSTQPSSERIRRTKKREVTPIKAEKKPIRLIRETLPKTERIKEYQKNNEVKRDKENTNEVIKQSRQKKYVKPVTSSSRIRREIPTKNNESFFSSLFSSTTPKSGEK